MTLCTLITRPAPRGLEGRAARLVAGILLLLGLTPAVSGAGGMLELAELVSHPEQYDRQMVAVTGQVSDLRAGKDREGRDVYGFLLREGESLVKVFGVGRTPVREGEHIVVEGVFHRLRGAGRAATYNQIKATLIRSLERLHPDLVG